MSVEAKAPRKPSQVFFGESLIRGVLPKKNPKKYAIMSLQMTKATGRTNQNNPSMILCITN